jgi:23S rRNA-/tRNA-specific pseudouridylate synthase
MGHPILGDAQYGKKFVCHFRPRRNLLHAYTISFKHPLTGKPVKVTAPIPSDFKQAIDELIK